MTKREGMKVWLICLTSAKWTLTRRTGTAGRCCRGAVVRKHEVVQLLLEKRASLDVKGEVDLGSMNSGKRAPLSWAAVGGSKVVVQLLLEK